MIQRIPARLFLFGSMHPVDWMTADEIAGMENLQTAMVDSRIFFYCASNNGRFYSV